jgi:hypothetical protein
VITFSYWSVKLWFHTEGKLTAVLIIPSSWGFPTGPVRHQKLEANPTASFSQSSDDYLRSIIGRMGLEGYYALVLEFILMSEVYIWFIQHTIIVLKGK